MSDIGGRRTGYHSAEAVLADARRRADQLRRHAEREAATIRREAAEWAAETRRDAERYRTEVLDELRALGESLEPELAAAPDVIPPGPGGEVIELRARSESRAPEVPEPEPQRVGTIETSIETKVHDVVRLALRRTFERARSMGAS